MRHIGIVLIALSLSAAEAPPSISTVRVKDLVSVEGVRENQLIGYGLVVGLSGTGDRRQTVFSAQSLANMLNRMGVSVPPRAIQVNNVAAVMVTATLPPFAQPGTRIDLTASSLGDASNLQGGQLLLTPLMGADGQVYSVGQGPVVTGGFRAGRGGNSQTVNHPTVGRVVNGGLVERAAPSVLAGKEVRLQLRRADFTAAARIAEAINTRFRDAGAAIAAAQSSGLVTVALPPAYQSQPVEFMAALEALTIQTDRAAKVVINERTGTIVMGKEVRIAPVAILHGNLSVEIQTVFAVSQPPALSGGETAVVPQIGVAASQETARNVLLKEGATVEDLIKALAAIGSTPRDVIAILQSLRAAGALDAEVEVI